jgi:hypothetical protein
MALAPLCAPVSLSIILPSESFTVVQPGGLAGESAVSSNPPLRNKFTSIEANARLESVSNDIAARRPRMEKMQGRVRDASEVDFIVAIFVWKVVAAIAEPPSCMIHCNFSKADLSVNRRVKRLMNPLRACLIMRNLPSLGLLPSVFVVQRAQPAAGMHSPNRVDSHQKSLPMRAAAFSDRLQAA